MLAGLMPNPPSPPAGADSSHDSGFLPRVEKVLSPSPAPSLQENGAQDEEKEKREEEEEEEPPPARRRRIEAPPKKRLWKPYTD